MMATGGETGREYDKHGDFYVSVGKNVMSAQTLKVSLQRVGVGTVLRLERDVW